MTTVPIITANPLHTVKLRVVFPRAWSLRLRVSAQIIRFAAWVAGVEASVEVTGAEPRA